MRIMKNEYINSLFIALLVLITVIMGSYALYFKAMEASEHDLKLYMTNLSILAGKQIDVEKHKSFVHRGQEKSADYKKEIKKLAVIKESFPSIAYIYTCIIKNGEVYFILDPTPENTFTEDGVEAKSHIMDKYEEAKDIPELMQAFNTKTTVLISQPYKDRWGEFVSAYTPFFDKNNNLVGVVGVDINATDYSTKINRIRDAEIICIIIGIINSIIIGFVVWRNSRKIRITNSNLLKRSQELEIINLELIKANKAAEMATVSKTSFLANMSHEIRTPMNGVLGVASLLMDTELNPRQKELVGIISKSSDLLLEIVNDILDVSKIEAGELKLEPINFSLRSSITDVMNLLLFRKDQQNQIDLKIEINQEVPDYYLADVVRVRQIISNLVSNSIKFTKQGSVTLRVKHEDIENKAARLFFEIEDTGIGIPKDKLDYIFNKFTQAEESTTRKFGGTGLGLSICKNLTKMMNGSIGVKSELGKGSTFFFDIILPYGNPGDVEMVYADSGVTIFKDAKVLVADDVTLNVMLIENMLKKRGCVVDKASNGVQAVDMIKNVSYQVVFMDCHMPEMDGYEATRVVRLYEKEKGKRRTPIIAVTADAMKGNRQKCIDSGMDDYLNKPIKETQIESMLKKWIQGHKEEVVLTKKNVLLVDDNDINRLVTKAMLEKKNVIVDEAEDGEEAVSKAALKKYDMIFMDYRLPKLSGVEAAAKIRDTINKTTYIIAFTGDSYTAEDIKKHGMDGYLMKPIDEDKILSVLQPIL